MLGLKSANQIAARQAYYRVPWVAQEEERIFTVILKSLFTFLILMNDILFVLVLNTILDLHD